MTFWEESIKDYWNCHQKGTSKDIINWIIKHYPSDVEKLEERSNFGLCATHLGNCSQMITTNCEKLLRLGKLTKRPARDRCKWEYYLVDVSQDRKVR